jgi:hypothetical protein
MRPLRVILLGLCFFVFASNELHADSTAHPPAGHVVKVLPLFMDLKGHVATSPSLYDRDAYQYYLRVHTNEVSGIRFDVEWKAQNAHGLNLKLRLELLGIGAGGLPKQTTLEQTVTPKFFRHWVSLTLNGRDYKNFGVLVAWRATLWNGDKLIGKQKSFLW